MKVLIERDLELLTYFEKDTHFQEKQRRQLKQHTYLGYETYFSQSRHLEEQQRQQLEEDYEISGIAATFGDILHIKDFEELEDDDTNNNEKEILEKDNNLVTQQSEMNYNRQLFAEDEINFEEDKQIPGTFGEYKCSKDYQQQKVENEEDSKPRNCLIDFFEQKNKDFVEKCDQSLKTEEELSSKYENNAPSDILQSLERLLQITSQQSTSNVFEFCKNEGGLVKQETQSLKSCFKRDIQPFKCKCGKIFERASSIKNHIMQMAKQGVSHMHVILHSYIQQGRLRKLENKELVKSLQKIYGKPLLDQDSLNTSQQVSAILQQFQNYIDEKQKKFEFEDIELIKQFQKDKMMLRPFFYQLPIQDTEQFIERYVKYKIGQQKKYEDRREKRTRLI